MMKKNTNWRVIIGLLIAILTLIGTIISFNKEKTIEKPIEIYQTISQGDNSNLTKTINIAEEDITILVDTVN